MLQFFIYFYKKLINTIMKVADIMAAKPIKETYSIQSSAMVIDALRLMAQHSIGALLVMDDGQLKGIFSERDYARKGILTGRVAINTPVVDVMTHKVITVSPDKSLDDCLQLMSNNRFRHLPVVHDHKVLGLISIGDVVKAVITEQENHISSLENYIKGNV